MTSPLRVFLSGERKHRNSTRKCKGETIYFLKRNNPPTIKCPHTVLDYKGKKKYLGKFLSTEDVENTYFACFLNTFQYIAYILVFRHHLFHKLTKLNKIAFN